MSDQQIVLVTGCSSGFGELIAKTSARAGYRVFATMRGVGDRNSQAKSELEAWAQEEEGVRLNVVEMDVAETASVRDAVAEVLREAGQIDVVVNNAGVAAGGPIEAFDIEQMQDLFNINVFGPLRVDKAVLPSMRERRSGLLIHVTSTLGRVLPRTGGLYPASKWAAEGLAESLHYQLKPFGVEAVILEPGSFPTPAVLKGLLPNDAGVAAAYAASSQAPRRNQEVSPDYRPPDPQEVADAVLKLIEMPPGRRPLRTVVGPVFTTGVAEFNLVYERARDMLAAALMRPDQAITWTRRR